MVTLTALRYHETRYMFSLVLDADLAAVCAVNAEQCNRRFARALDGAKGNANEAKCWFKPNLRGM